MSEFRIPRSGDKVTIEGLVSASQYNGTGGTVAQYLMDKNRYEVRLNVGGKKKVLAVKRENVALRAAKENLGPNDVAMHVLIPCHMTDDRRCAQFFECAKSLCEQCDIAFRCFFGISGTKERRDEAVGMLRHLNCGLVKNRKVKADWYILAEEGQNQKAQFEHIKDMYTVSSSIDSSAWLMFLDNDDMYRPERVEHFKRQALRCDAGLVSRHVDVFWSGGKLLLDAAEIGERYVTLEKLLRGDDSLDGIVRVAATPGENSVLDVDEYFDFCCRSFVLGKFLELTPDEMLKNSFCDVRFLASLGRMCDTAFPHPEIEWLLMHYRLKHIDRNKAFKDKDPDRHSNAMMSVEISDADRDLSEKTGLEPWDIAWARKDVEEGAIQFIARDDQNLEERRKRLTTQMNKNFGNDIGTLLWRETCEKFMSFFSEDLLHKNKAWCMEGRASYTVYTEEVDDSIDNHY